MDQEKSLFAIYLSHCVDNGRRIDLLTFGDLATHTRLGCGAFPAILRVSRRGTRQHFYSSDLISNARTRSNTSDAEHGPLVRWLLSVPVLAMSADRLSMARSDSPDRTGRKVL